MQRTCAHAQRRGSLKQTYRRLFSANCQGKSSPAPRVQIYAIKRALPSAEKVRHDEFLLQNRDHINSSSQPASQPFAPNNRICAHQTPPTAHTTNACYLLNELALTQRSPQRSTFVAQNTNRLYTGCMRMCASYRLLSSSATIAIHQYQCTTLKSMRTRKARTHETN